MNSLKGIGSFTTVLFAALILSACSKDKDAKTNTASGPPPAPKVSSFALVPKELQSHVDATGTLLANEEVELKPEVSGRILKIYFREGSTVSKGQLLVKINDSDLQAQLKKIALTEQLAAQDEARQRQLLAIKGNTQEEYDISLNKLKTAQAEKELLLSQLEKTSIIAPFSGTIGLKNISEGAYVTPATIIASIEQINPIKIEFSLPEKYSGLIKNGTQIQFRVNNKEAIYKAVVYAVEPKVDMVSRTLKIRAHAENKSSTLFPGTFASISVTLEKITNALIVPTEAIVPNINKQNVFVYKSGFARLIPVETGIRTDSEIQIVNGLQRGDTIITSGILQLRDSIKVELK
jgi:membrane fusion protein, multidrug efflux system